MANLNECEKLRRYEDALEALPIEMQFDKAEAIKSQANVRRFLSENAPENLAKRFSHRIGEVMNGVLTDFERGRIYYLQGENEEAFEYMRRAYRNGRTEAIYYLGRIFCNTGHYNEAINCFSEALHQGIEVEESLAGISICLAATGNKDEVKKFCRRGLKRKPCGKTPFFRGLVNCVNGKCADAKVEFINGAEEGDEDALVFLGRCLGEKGGVLDHKSEEKIARAMIGKGYLKAYLPLAIYQQARGDLSGAAESYVKALICGDTNAVERLSVLCLSKEGLDEVISALEKYARKGHKEFYSNVILLCFTAGRMEQAIKQCDAQFRSGMRVNAVYNLVKMQLMAGDRIAKAMISAMQKGEEFCDELVALIYGIKLPEDVLEGKKADNGGLN